MESCFVLHLLTLKEIHKGCLPVLCSNTAEWLRLGKSPDKRQMMVPYCMDKAGKLVRYAGNLGRF